MKNIRTRSLRLSFKRITKRFHNLKTKLKLKRVKSTISKIKKKKKYQKMKSCQHIIATNNNFNIRKIPFIVVGYLAQKEVLRIEKLTRFQQITTYFNFILWKSKKKKTINLKKRSNMGNPR